MAKFLSNRDWKFVQHINSELSEEIVQSPVILYKINLNYTETNIYGETDQRVYYTPTELTAFILYPDNTAISEGPFGISQEQSPQFRFVREILRSKEIYPESGDVIQFNNLYYEIDNVKEVQLLASRPEYNHSIICETHITRKSIIDIEPRQI